MNTLLPELWLELLEYFNCQELNILKLVSISILDLITNNNLFDKRKFRGFPRPEGYCVLHETFKIDDLVRGDLLNKDSIFDGHKLIKMKCIDYFERDETFRLPNEFTIINHGVPVDYWSKTGCLQYRTSWINIDPFREQCLESIRYKDDFISYNYTLYQVMTDFDYNGKNYEIFYMSNGVEDKEDTYIKFKQIINKEDKIYVEWDNVYDDFLLDSCYQDYVI